VLTAVERSCLERYLILECGRQIGPQFRTLENCASPRDDRDADFLDHVRRDEIRLYPPAPGAGSSD
jgi:hypothetical protein